MGIGETATLGGFSGYLEAGREERIQSVQVAKFDTYGSLILIVLSVCIWTCFVFSFLKKKIILHVCFLIFLNAIPLLGINFVDRGFSGVLND